MKYGIDVSRCQGTINWVKLKSEAPDVKFAIIRTGYSYGAKYDDQQFMANVSCCRANGIDIYGVYHFSYAISVNDAIREARSCVEKMKAANLPKSTIAFFDFEYESERFCKDNNVTATKEFVTKITTAFCDEIKDAGFVPGVYTNEDCYVRLYGKSFPDNVVKVWAARWITPSSNLTSDFNNAKKRPTFAFNAWQYGDRIIPCVGKVDADVILDDKEIQKTEEVKMESRKSNEEVAKEVVRGDWGNGAERRRLLEEAGYDYRAVQNIVNTYFE